MLLLMMSKCVYFYCVQFIPYILYTLIAHHKTSARHFTGDKWHIVKGAKAQTLSEWEREGVNEWSEWVSNWMKERKESLLEDEILKPL